MPYPAEQLGAGRPPKDRELELPWLSTTPVHLPSTATSTTTPGSARSSGRFRAQRAVASHGALSRITSTPVRSETARVELNSKWGSCRRDSTGPRSTSTATFRPAGSRTSAWRRRRPSFESFPHANPVARGRKCTARQARPRPCRSSAAAGALAVRVLSGRVPRTRCRDLRGARHGGTRRPLRRRAQCAARHNDAVRVPHRLQPADRAALLHRSSDRRRTGLRARPERSRHSRRRARLFYHPPAFRASDLLRRQTAPALRAAPDGGVRHADCRRHELLHRVLHRIDSSLGTEQAPVR